MESKDSTAISQRLDVVIALLLRLIPEGKTSVLVKDQILLLKALGLRPVEIAHILGKNESYISKELAVLKKKGH